MRVKDHHRLAGVGSLREEKGLHHWSAPGRNVRRKGELLIGSGYPVRWDWGEAGGQRVRKKAIFFNVQKEKRRVGEKYSCRACRVRS